MTQSIQQKRAAYALQQVMALKQSQPEAVQKRFKAYSNSLPAMIQMNGIGQALAFAYQKSSGDKDENKGWKALLDTVSTWLLQREIWGKQATGANVVQVLSGGTQKQYQLAQAEAQALLSWVKDFARAEIAGVAAED